MKTVKVLMLVAIILAAGGRLRAQPFTNSASTTVNLGIPDNDASGVASTIQFSSAQIDRITDVNVTLNISGNFNGDLYGYLSFGSGFSVLLNRTGRTAANSLGYSDGGFNITLDDEATNGDIHTYRVTLNPGGGALNGAWAPDGRNTSGGNGLDTDPRSALLNGFDGLNPNGPWALFVADLSPGGTSRLNSWGLQVVGVPEPGTWVLLALGGGLLFCLGRRKRMR